MDKFAKLFEVNGQQVLITKNWDEEEQLHQLTQRTDLDGGVVEMSLGFKTELGIDDAFEQCTETNANLFLEHIETEYGNMFTPDEGN